MNLPWGTLTPDRARGSHPGAYVDAAAACFGHNSVDDCVAQRQSVAPGAGEVVSRVALPARRIQNDAVMLVGVAQIDRSPTNDNMIMITSPNSMMLEPFFTPQAGGGVAERPLLERNPVINKSIAYIVTSWFDTK